MTGREQIGIRCYGDVSMRHAYLADQVAELEECRIQQIHPVCHDNPLDYVLAHPGDMIATVPFANLGGTDETCPRCAHWLATHPHEVIADGEVVAIHDLLPLPQQARRERVAAVKSPAAP